MKFKGTIISEASGSLAGLTFSHNRGGQYIRARAVPVNPGSSGQVAIRGFLSLLTSSWVSLLTEVQRAGWDAYALQVQLPDALGEPRNIGGIAHYVRSNVSRLQALLPRVDDAPIIHDLGEFTNPAIASITAPTALSLTFTDADLWANEDDSAMLVYGSRGRNESINYFKGPYRFAGLIAGDAITAPTSPAAIVMPFPLTAGQKAFVQIRISRADGRLSSPFRLDDIVV